MGNDLIHLMYYLYDVVPSSTTLALVQWLKLPAWKVEDMQDRTPLWPSRFKDLQVSNFELCVWRAVPSHSSQHPQEVFWSQFSI